MAGNFFAVSSGDVVCSTTPTTILQVRSLANVGRMVRKITITGKSAAGDTNAPSKVRVTTSGQTGTCSAATEGLPPTGETPVGSSKITFTVEPTTPVAAGYQRSVSPMGKDVIVFDPPRRIPGGQALNVEITAAAGTPTFNVEADLEE